MSEYVRFEPPAVPTTFWRGVGPNNTVFSRECFMDVIARRIGKDPVALRRDLLRHQPRALWVLDEAVGRAGRNSPFPTIGLSGRPGRGVALLSAFGSFLVAVADVLVADDGAVRVTRVVVAADVGTIISPNTVEAQVQGGVIFGLSSVLHGNITVAGGRVLQSNFHDYRVMRINEAPEIEVVVRDSVETPGGIGEPGTVVVQPAVVNAVYAATGVRLSRMPIDQSLIAIAR